MTEQRRSEHSRGRGAGRVGVIAAFMTTCLVVFVLANQQSSASQQVPAGGQSAASLLQDATAGEDVYSANCASCHQAGGAGLPGTFPPLAGNPNVSDPAYVESVVRDGKSGPIDVNGETYDSTMAPVPGLSEEEIADVSAYVASLSEGGAPPVEDPVEEVPDEGTVVGGEDLFIGSTALEAGGTACVGCHTAGSVGNLGGPGLGPDLTDAAENLGGEAGLAAWLANPPSPTMQPIFGDQPLSSTEIADLTAFLVDAPEQSEPNDSVDWLSVAAIVGVLVLLGGMAIAYRGMRQTYAEKLRTRGRPAARSDRRTS